MDFFQFLGKKNNNNPRVDRRVTWTFLYHCNVTDITHRAGGARSQQSPALPPFCGDPHPSGSSTGWPSQLRTHSVMRHYQHGRPLLCDLRLCVVGPVGLEMTNPAWLYNVSVWQVKVFELRCHSCLFSWLFPLVLGNLQGPGRHPHIVKKGNLAACGLSYMLELHTVVSAIKWIFWPYALLLDPRPSGSFYSAY